MHIFGVIIGLLLMLLIFKILGAILDGTLTVMLLIVALLVGVIMWFDSHASTLAPYTGQSVMNEIIQRSLDKVKPVDKDNQ